MIDFKVVYTVSSKGNMIVDLLESIRSVRRFVKKNDIIVFYTPPRTKDDIYELEEYVNVTYVQNLTKPFIAKKGFSLSRYGEKVWLCTVDSPNVIFLDNDTIVLKDIKELLKGDFDFYARIDTGNKSMNQKAWLSLCKSVGKRPIPMPNAGFMIFKNWIHKRICKEFRFFIDNPHTLFSALHPKSYLKDQYAMALAVSGYKIKWMSKREHRFSFEIGDTYVIHGKPSTTLGSRKLYELKIMLFKRSRRYNK